MEVMQVQLSILKIEISFIQKQKIKKIGLQYQKRLTHRMTLLIGFVASTSKNLNKECLTSLGFASIFMPKVLFSKTGKESIADLCDRSLRTLFENYIQPLREGYSTEELEGKYKPSWELPKTYSGNSVMKVALAKFAKKNDLYHYHFGCR